MSVWLLLAPTLVFAAANVTIAAWRALIRVRGHAPEPGGELPRIAVLVAARNEEPRLARCLDALQAQKYPAGRLSIYVADDHSTDGTSAVIDCYADEAHSGLHPVRAVHVPDGNGELRGKALAIHSAIAHSDEELLLITDADCAPPPGWAREMVRAFDDPRVGIVSARTTIDPAATTSGRALHAIQTLDWTYLLTACAFLVEIGRPITAMGNNMALRRGAYDEVGGYPALRFSVTEDYELFRTIVRKTRWRARFLVDRDSRVLTLPLESLSETYMQRRRWARGGLRAPLGVYLAYAGTHLAHLLPLLVLPFAPIPVLTTLGVKLLADLILLVSALERDTRPALRRFLAWEAYLFAYTVSLPMVLLFAPRIRWKDRSV